MNVKKAKKDKQAVAQRKEARCGEATQEGLARVHDIQTKRSSRQQSLAVASIAKHAQNTLTASELRAFIIEVLPDLRKRPRATPHVR